MSTWKELSNKSLLSIALKSIAAVSLFLFNLVIARYYSVEEAGFIFGSVSFSIFISTLISLGLHIYFLKNVAKLNIEKSFDQIYVIIMQGFIYSFLAFLFFLTIYSLGGIFFDILKNTNISHLSPLLSILMCFVLLASYILRGFKNIGYAILFEKIFPYLIPIFLLIFLKDININTLFIVICSSFFICFVILTLSIFNKLPLRPKIKSLNNKLFSGLSSLWITVLSSQFFIHFPVILVSLLLSKEDVALFSVSYNISLLIPFFLTAVNNAYSPVISELYSQKKYNELISINKKVIKLIFISTAPIIILVLFFSDIILSLFGDNYTSAKYLLIYLSIAQVINVLVGSTANLLNMTGNEKVLRNINVISIIIFFIYILFSLKSILIIDIVIALSIAIIVKNLLSYVAVKKLLGINSLKLN